MRLQLIAENKWIGKYKTVNVTILKNIDGVLKDKFTFFIQKDKRSYNSVLTQQFDTLEDAIVAIEKTIKIWK